MTASGSTCDFDPKDPKYLYHKKPEKCRTKTETDAIQYKKDCFSCTMNGYMFCGAMALKGPERTMCWPKFIDESAHCRPNKNGSPSIGRIPTDCNDKEINP